MNMLAVEGAADRTSGDSKREIVFIGLLIAAVFLAWLPRSRGVIDLRWDSGVYYVVGTALAEGKGYRLLNEPGEIKAIQYPPLLPGIVAIHQKVLKTDHPLIVGVWLRRAWFLFFLAYVLGTYYLAKIYLPSQYSFIVAILSCFNFYTIYESDMATPEILYALSSLLFFVLYKKQGVKNTVPAVLAAVCAYYLRTIGIALLIAWAIEPVFRKKFRRFFLRFVLTLIFISPWLIYVRTVEHSTEYSHPVYQYQRANYLFYNVSYIRNISLKDPFTPEMGKASLRDWSGRFLENFQNIPMNIAETITIDQHSWYRYFQKWIENSRLPVPWAVWYVSLVLLGCVVLTGVIFQLLRQERLFFFYILFSLAAICISPWPSHASRYLVPLLPFLVISLVLLLLRTIPSKIALVALLGIVVLQQITVFNLYRRHLNAVAFEAADGESGKSRWFYFDPDEESWTQALSWLRRNAERQDLIACSMPQSVYLHTGLKAVMVPFLRDPAEAQQLLDSIPARYLILDQTRVNISQRYAAPIVRKFPELWKKVYVSENGAAVVYERVKS